MINVRKGYWFTLPGVLMVAGCATAAGNGNDIKRTMADMRVIATVAEAFATDQNAYPTASTHEELRSQVEPVYVKSLPERDAWGTPYIYVADPTGKSYRIISAGADRKFEKDWRTAAFPSEERVTRDYALDLVFENGLFVSYPQE